MSLIDRALNKHLELQEANKRNMEEDKIKHGREAKKAFTEMFDVEPDYWDGTYIEHEGWRFEFLRGIKNFALIGECPQCGEEVESLEIRNITQLGEMIANFQPHFGHYCTAGKSTPPILQEIENAINRAQDVSNKDQSDALFMVALTLSLKGILEKLHDGIEHYTPEY